MKIYTALQIGEYHLNNCDDYLVVCETGSDKILCAVMDGCTMAPDSYFASTLVGKLLRKIAKEKGYKELYNLEKSSSSIDDDLRYILRELFRELTITKNQLLLDQKELLTTLIILLVDKKAGNGILLAIGDGLVSVNGNLTEFDHDNKPDYIGFHLTENFDAWYSSQAQKIHFTSIQDITIATDGILTFTKIAETTSKEQIDPVAFMVDEKANTENEDMLQLKLKKLEHVHGLKPTDDLALIRIIGEKS